MSDTMAHKVIYMALKIARDRGMVLCSCHPRATHPSVILNIFPVSFLVSSRGRCQSEIYHIVGAEVMGPYNFMHTCRAEAPRTAAAKVGEGSPLVCLFPAHLTEEGQGS